MRENIPETFTLVFDLPLPYLHDYLNSCETSLLSDSSI